MEHRPEQLAELKPMNGQACARAIESLLRSMNEPCPEPCGPAERFVGVCCSWTDATDDGACESLMKSVRELSYPASSVVVLEFSSVIRADCRLVACIVCACRLGRRAGARVIAVVSRSVADWLAVCGVSKIIPHVVA